MPASRTRKRAHKALFDAKKMARLIFLSSFVLLASFYLPKIAKLNYFPITDVKIFGVQHINHQDVQALIAPLIERGFFKVEIDVVRQRLAALPWVSEVVVKRVWPNHLTVVVHEKQSRGLWNDEALLSATGEIFSPPKETYPPDLPQFVAPLGEQQTVLAYYDQINNLLAPLQFKIARLELSRSMLWKITLTNGIKLNLGHKDVLERLSHFVKVYPKIIGTKKDEVEYIDLRYSNGVAIRWKTVA